MPSTQRPDDPVASGNCRPGERTFLVGAQMQRAGSPEGVRPPHTKLWCPPAGRAAAAPTAPPQPSRAEQAGGGMREFRPPPASTVSHKIRWRATGAWIRRPPSGGMGKVPRRRPVLRAAAAAGLAITLTRQTERKIRPAGGQTHEEKNARPEGARPKSRQRRPGSSTVSASAFPPFQPPPFGRCILLGLPLDTFGNGGENAHLKRTGGLFWQRLPPRRRRLGGIQGVSAELHRHVRRSPVCTPAWPLRRTCVCAWAGPI